MLVRPRLRVPGADVDEPRLRIVSRAIPYRSPASVLPPFLVPGLGRFLHRGVFKTLRWIPRHRVEAPRAPAGHRVVGIEEAACRPIAAAGADDDLALRDPRRHRQRVLILRKRDA